MFYGIVVNETGFILSAYAGVAPLPEGYTAITEDLYLQIVPCASYVNGAIVPPSTGSIA
ncbi:hypothetical protein [Paraburkholderia acidiphila]|uniref:Uncharacterized protein n=1 Tax=Paraburkholderia acidiphila TaxID=2571747 RepID=A0A7Z2G7Q4_9BURK|nr:hypothetical protein [Paraburkholderia acidiphila]QGZ56763.1 hypothetical protein FAZ97_17525 [Paraburkholderia acidiphila]